MFSFNKTLKKTERYQNLKPHVIKSNATKVFDKNFQNSCL